MLVSELLSALFVGAPAVAMAVLAGLAHRELLALRPLWRVFPWLSGVAAAWAGLGWLAGSAITPLPGFLNPTPLGQAMALLVQGLGTVIAAFSARYLEGEARQSRYAAALAAVLACVQLLLLADHWLLLVAAWAGAGLALQTLLCFYAERPFALLAAHKKRMADRLADVLLLAAMALAWSEVGSGSLSALWAHIGAQGLSPRLQGCALLLVLAVTLRTALLPVHGWLIQVMEAPTPVSALLHAGVVNLGGFVLIRFAPLLEQAVAARWVLMLLGLGTAVLAGMVMLTRISIKVQLAWSTVAQMGFLLLECALGLYSLAALHLIGHSLYKAHAFLSASSVVQQTRVQAMHGHAPPSAASRLLAPVLSTALVFGGVALAGGHAWPGWWSAVLGLAWAPLLWRPAGPARDGSGLLALAFGLGAAAALTAMALAAHRLPLGLRDAPDATLGAVALIALAGLYLCQALLPQATPMLARWRRWSYAGFYLDEAYTRLALRLWPVAWAPTTQLITPLTTPVGAPRGNAPAPVKTSP